MKKLKKLAALVLAAAMALAMGMTSFAAGTHTITINGGTHSLDGVEFTAYRLFDATKSGDSYGYTVTAPFKEYLAVKAEGASSESIYDYVKTQLSTASKAQTFLAGLKTAIDNTITGADSVKKEQTGETGATSVEFTNMAEGFYVIYSSSTDYSTMTVTLVDSNANVNVKVGEPEIDKEITGEGNGDDYQIGDTVNFKVTIDIPSVKSGFESYTFKFNDTMSDGLTLDKDSIKLHIPTTPINTDLTKDTDYKLTVIDPSEPDNETKISINFVTGDKDNGFFSEKLKNNAGGQIVIEYSATLNDKATHVDPETNKAEITYTRNNGTEATGTPDRTKVYTHEMIIQKYKESVSGDNKLAGAEFEIYETTGEDGALETRLEFVNTGEGIYRVATATDREKTPTLVADSNGQIKIEGLDSGWYAAVETKAPAGYNGLDDPEYIQIRGQINDATGDPVEEGYDKTVTLEVINKAGSLLPETGGMGTVLFTVIGAVLIIAVGTSFVVSRKRRAER